jgi:hypothetical protein
MNERDVTTLLGLIQARYPKATLYPAMSDPQQALALTVKVWAGVLDDVRGEDVLTVFHQWSKNEKWAPDPSELRERAMNLDGRRLKRIFDLRLSYRAGGLTNPDAQAELAELESGQPLRDYHVASGDAPRDVDALSG